MDINWPKVIQFLENEGMRLRTMDSLVPGHGHERAAILITAAAALRAGIGAAQSGPQLDEGSGPNQQP